jgi:predicted DCC family thiol-disulfide oxidoreductase YuxK
MGREVSIDSAAAGNSRQAVPGCINSMPAQQEHHSLSEGRLARGAASGRAPLVLIDGVCNLCNAWVRFIVRRDPTGIFRFSAQQSATGRALIEDHMSGANQLSSVILVEDSVIYIESDAILRILARLRPPWSWMGLLRIIPRRVRDACYRFIANHRYRWFGRTDLCQIPSADVRSRFIE